MILLSLPAPLVLPIVLAAALLPGLLAVSLWRDEADANRLEVLFAGLSLGVMGLGWVALVLAEAGWFSLAALAAVWAGGVLILAVLVWRRFRGGRALLQHLSRRPLELPSGADLSARRSNRLPAWEAALLALWAIAAGWLFFRPHEYLLGGADAGVYISLGANIAHTGAILIHDPLLAGLDPALQGALLRVLPPSEQAPYYIFPGFYVPGSAPGLIIPQFYPLHPVWQAVGYALGGLRAELLMTPFWAWLSCLAVYLAVRRALGRQAALLSLAGLTVCALQVWFARYPTAEMLTQYLLWTGLWAAAMWLENRSPRGLWATLAGLAFGEVLLTRIDMYVMGVFLLAVGVWLIWRREWRRGDSVFFVAFGALAVHSLVHGRFWSTPYFLSLFGFSQRILGRLPLLIAGALAAAAVAALVVQWRYGWARAAARVASWAGARPAGRGVYWRYGCAILLAGLGIYGYFVRPAVTPVQNLDYWYGGGQLPTVDQENLVRLGWYLGPAGVALGILGMGWLVIKAANRRTMLLWGMGLFFSLFYLWQLRANPHQVYAMRRYVPLVLPFFIVAAAGLLAWLYARRIRWQRWAAVGLAIIWMYGILVSARGFVSQIDYRGLTGQLDQLNAAVAAHSILLFNDAAPVSQGDSLGTPLRFLYGQEVFTLRDPQAVDRQALAAAIRGWQTAGHAVYWIETSGGYPFPLDAQMLTAPTDHTLTVPVLEGTYDHKPYRLLEAHWQFAVRRIAEIGP
jgi:hypothetical protein